MPAFFKWAILGLFLNFFCLFKLTLQFSQQINVKKSIQFMVLVFKPLTFRTRVSSFNHLTRAPAHAYACLTAQQALEACFLSRELGKFVR